jgi:hypothetical protein
MRLMVALLGVVLMAACAGHDTEREPAITTTSQVPATTTTFESVATTTTAQTTSTVPSSDNDDPDAESIGVTDRVTIVITDPEDG